MRILRRSAGESVSSRSLLSRKGIELTILRVGNTLTKALYFVDGVPPASIRRVDNLLADEAR